MDNNQTVDKDALNLTHAIALSESDNPGQPNYNAVGKSGEKGAYQWMPGNYETQAKEAGFDPNDFSPATQDKVAYYQVKKLKDQGLQPYEIAAQWNSGSPENYQNHSGVNDRGVSYDTPAYVQKVKDNYLNMIGKSQSSTAQVITEQAQPTNAIPITSQEQTLRQELGSRFKQGTEGLKTIVQGTDHGTGLLSGSIQTLGAVGGAVGDVVNKSLELIPGVKAIEGIIGKGLGKLAETPVGQSVVNSLQEFGQKHPELSKDLSAGFNIVTSIPILRGLGVVKNIALDGASSALKGVAEKIANKDFTSTVERTIGGRNALKASPDAIKTLVQERAIPDIADGKYTTQEAYDKLSQNISGIEDNELQPALQKASGQTVSQRVPIEDLRKEALDTIKQEFKTSGQVGKAESEVNRVMDDYKKSYGEYVTLQDINDMKRGIRESVNFASPKIESDVTYHLGQTFMKNIENSATKLGLGDIHAINQKMARLIKAQNILKHLEGKPIKTGFTSGLIKNAATIGGEALGDATGVPFAGALVGRGVGGNIGKKLTGGVEGILKRTGKNAERVSQEELKKKLGGLFGGAVSQKVNR